MLLVGIGGAAWCFMKPATPEKHAAVMPLPALPVFVEIEAFTVNLAGERILQLDITL